MSQRAVKMDILFAYRLSHIASITRKETRLISNYKINAEGHIFPIDI